VRHIGRMKATQHTHFHPNRAAIAATATGQPTARRGILGMAFALASLGATGLPQAATYSVARQLNMPSGSLSDCDGGLTTRTFINDKDEVATVCRFSSVGISFDGLFGVTGAPIPYGSLVSKAVIWRAGNATPTVAGQPGLGSATLLDLRGLSNQGQVLAKRSGLSGYTTALWTSTGGWKTIKFVASGVSGRSISAAGDVLGAGYEKGVHIVQSWTAGKLTTLNIPDSHQSLMGWAPAGPVLLVRMGGVDTGLPAPLSLWTPAGQWPLPNWGSLVPAEVEALNTRGQYMARMGEPLLNENGAQRLGPYQLVFFDGSQHFAVEGLLPANAVLSLNESGRALISSADATGVLPPRDMVWSPASADILPTAARLPAGFTYGRALAMNNLGRVVVEAKDAKGKKTWFVLKPD